MASFSRQLENASVRRNSVRKYAGCIFFQRTAITLFLAWYLFSCGAWMQRDATRVDIVPIRGGSGSSAVQWRGRGRSTSLFSSAFPFGGFSGMGGGFGSSAPPPKKQKKGPDTDFYAELELRAEDAASITEKDIKQRYRQLSRKYHPDAATGEEVIEDGEDDGASSFKRSNLSDSELKEKYIRIQTAYEILSDPLKRKMYDLQGEDGLEVLEQYDTFKKGNMGGNPMNQHPLAAMMGQMGGGPGGNPFQAASKEMELQVPLAHILTGATENIQYQKKCVCARCKGRGAPPDSSIRQCSQCKGQGAVLMNLQIGPGMMQQVVQPCPRCSGKGSTYSKKCQTCSGSGVHTCTVKKAVEVPKGVGEGDFVRFSMEGDEEVGKVPGDLVLRMKSAPHPSFTRRQRGGKADLDTTLTISLSDALLGFRRELTHMDGNEKVVLDREQRMTPFDTVLKVAGKGLPFGSGRAGRGDLYVKVSVQLPTFLGAAQKEAIAAAFGDGAEKSRPTEDPRQPSGKTDGEEGDRSRIEGDL